MIRIVQGDHFERALQLTENDIPFTIGPEAVVRARVVHLATGAQGEIVTTDGSEPAANWSASLIVVTMPTEVTTTLTVGRSKIEVEVADPEPQTWFFDDVLVLPQTIT